MNTQKIAIVASLAAAAIALSGCNSGNADSPTQSPTHQTSASPTHDSPSPKPTPSKENKYKPASAAGPAENVPIPKMPAEAKKNTEAGAAAFAVYYFKLINYVIETNNPEPIKPLTSRQCTLCGKSIIDTATLAQKTGKWQVGGAHHMSVIDSYVPTKGKGIVSIRYKVDSSKFYIKPNQIESELKKIPSSVLALELTFDGNWKVDEISGEG